jgi:16S rRNA (guanine527-N7)-methyltransferase
VNENAPGLAQSAGALGIKLDAHQLEQFAAYAELLALWSQRFNLLGPSALSSLWSRHFVDALTIVRALPLTDGVQASVIDVGSGAGIPGIPLRIAFPHLRMSLLEVTAKKARFLERAIHELALENTTVLHGRAEELAHDARYREAFDLCVARAVSRAAALLEVTLPFVARGGAAVLYKTRNVIGDELLAAEDARIALGAASPTVTPVDDLRCLVRFNKIAHTPRSLPRGAGVPEMRPITSSDRATIEAATTEAKVRGRRRSAR